MANYKSRVGAYIIDLIFIYVSSIFITNIISKFTYDFLFASFLGVYVNIALLIINVIYLPSSTWQGSIGQKILGIKVIDINGNTISFWRSCYRYAIFAFCIWGIFMYFLNNKRQCLHDWLSDTIVINKGQYPIQYFPLKKIRFSIIVIAIIVGLLPIAIYLRNYIFIQ